VNAINQREDEDQAGPTSPALDATQAKLHSTLVLLENPHARGQTQQHNGDEHTNHIENDHDGPFSPGSSGAEHPDTPRLSDTMTLARPRRSRWRKTRTAAAKSPWRRHPNAPPDTMAAMARLGVLTGGGDCPGLNAVIRAVVRTATRDGHDLVGFHHGWAGVLAGDGDPLTLESTKGILHRGGTILGSSRTNPYGDGADGTAAVRASMVRHGVDALVAIGGEDTLGVAGRLSADGVAVVGVPKTIDNDLAGTDVTFGFHTAVQIATDAIDRLHTTAESHNRVMVVEVMGRHAGWIAAYAGIAGGADVILVPERPFDIDEVCAMLNSRHATGRTFSIVVVSEGARARDEALATSGSDAVDAFGHERLGGVAVQLEREIEARTGYETRMTILGHVQRGGTPTAYDRVLATRFGVAAARAVHDGATGTMVALRGTAVERIPLTDALATPKLLDAELYATAEIFFG